MEQVERVVAGRCSRVGQSIAHLAEVVDGIVRVRRSMVVRKVIRGHSGRSPDERFVRVEEKFVLVAASCRRRR